MLSYHISARSIRRMARRAGVKRLSNGGSVELGIYDNIRYRALRFLRKVLRRALLYETNAQHTTLTLRSIVAVMKDFGGLYV